MKSKEYKMDIESLKTYLSMRFTMIEEEWQ